MQEINELIIKLEILLAIKMEKLSFDNQLECGSILSKIKFLINKKC